jgi:hypothetical protein
MQGRKEESYTIILGNCDGKNDLEVLEVNENDV